MKKRMGLVVIVIALAALIGACQDGVPHNEAEPVQSSDYIRLTFINPIVGNGYWNMTVEGIKAADAEFGINTKCIGPSTIDADEQLEAIEAAIAAQVDGIITMALDSEEFTPVIDKAVSAGIPTILIDTDAPQSNRTAYIGTSNKAAGSKAGQKMIELTGGIAKIAVINGPPSQTNLQERVEGFEEAIANAPGMQIVTIEDGYSDLLQISEKVRAMLEAHPDITAFYCTDGNGTVGVGRIINEKTLFGKYTVIGFDDLPETLTYVKNGVVDAIVVQQPYRMGYLSVKYLMEIINERKTPMGTTYTEAVVVTKENAATYENGTQ